MSGLLDSFTRADSTSLGTNWTADILGQFYGSFDIVTNAAKVGSGAYDSNWWNVASFTAAQDVYATIVTMPTTSFRLYARLANPGTNSCTGYELEIDTTTSYIVRLDTAGVRVTLLNLSTVFANGNKAKLECSGTTLTAYRDTGAGWVSLGSTTDSYYDRVGYIGMLAQNTTALTVDDFGGGAIAPPAPPAGSARRTLMGAGG